jgi:hypothetical protein
MKKQHLICGRKVRKRIEEIFGWIKTVCTLRKVRYRGTEKVSWYFTLAVAAYNLVRMRNLGKDKFPFETSIRESINVP